MEKIILLFPIFYFGLNTLGFLKLDWNNSWIFLLYKIQKLVHTKFLSNFLLGPKILKFFAFVEMNTQLVHDFRYVSHNFRFSIF